MMQLHRKGLGAARLLLAALLLAAALACCAAQQQRQPPIDASLAPVTDLRAFKPTYTTYLDGLRKLSTSTSYRNYLTATKQPFVMSSKRQATFAANLKRIVDLNKGTTTLKHTFGINKFTHLDVTERVKYLGLRRSSMSTSQATADNVAKLRSSARTTAAEMETASQNAYATAAAARASRVQAAQFEDIPDWTSVLPSVKNQGGCGSCWAFASTAVTEAASYINTQTVISLSEKQLVDCNTGNKGCDGGWFDSAFQYEIDNGLTSSAMYPYVARRDSCPANLTPVSRLATYTALEANNEEAMLQALKNGPIAVALFADTPFLEYAGGVFTSGTCGDGINHAVVIVGAGRDEDLQEDYWLIRNSWGEDWGEGGYMRIQRGTNMCNVAVAPYQVTSADKGDGTPPPPPPPPTPDCQDTTVTVAGKMSLADLAKQYKTTTEQIQLDNSLNDPLTQLEEGRELLITCPSGFWSEPFGVWDNWNGANAMTAVPAVHACPDGTYAMRFYIKPSKWYTADAWTGNTWVGQITMTCSDGSEFTVDAQPGFNPGWADGTVDQPNGFTSIDFKSGWAIDSVFGVGAQSGGEQKFSCPANTVVTGFAAGASPGQYPEGWISNLAFRCSNPFGTDSVATKKVTALTRPGAFPKVASGLSCKVYAAKGTDTWQSVANDVKVKAFVNELVRANPSTTGSFSKDPKKPTKLFIPPCNEGVLQGTKVSTRAAAVGLDQRLPLTQAVATARKVDVESLVVAEAAQPSSAEGA